MIFAVGTFTYAHQPAFWPIPTMFLGAATAASAVGFINMVGNLGGFFGPKLVGESATNRTSFAPALLILAPFPLVGAAIILVVGYARRKRPAKVETKTV
jgi:nitrate/nitrite transporter NarK